MSEIMSEWDKEWVRYWVNEILSEWDIEWVRYWVSEILSEWDIEWVRYWVSEILSESDNEWVNAWMKIVSDIFLCNLKQYLLNIFMLLLTKLIILISNTKTCMNAMQRHCWIFLKGRGARFPAVHFFCAHFCMQRETG